MRASRPRSAGRSQAADSARPRISQRPAERMRSPMPGPTARPTGRRLSPAVDPCPDRRRGRSRHGKGRSRARGRRCRCAHEGFASCRRPSATAALRSDVVGACELPAGVRLVGDARIGPVGRRPDDRCLPDRAAPAPGTPRAGGARTAPASPAGWRRSARSARPAADAFGAATFSRTSDPLVIAHAMPNTISPWNWWLHRSGPAPHAEGEASVGPGVGDRR